MESQLFDEISNEYDLILKEGLSRYGELNYYGKMKAEYVRRILSSKNVRLIAKAPHTILDFGCGVGRNLPHLKQAFPEAELYAFDISKKSLDIALKNNAGVIGINEGNIDSFVSVFDVIFVSGVFHHIQPDERFLTVRRLRYILNESGTVFVFEHNPINPITRRIVKDCPFDKDASLINKEDLISLFLENDLSFLGGAYTLFVPSRLKAINHIERFLEWLPLGAQYCAYFGRITQ